MAAVAVVRVGVPSLEGSKSLDDRDPLVRGDDKLIRAIRALLGGE